MEEFNILLAEIPFRIKCLFSTTKQYCREYLFEGKTKYDILICEKDIEYERRINTLVSSDQYLETLALFRKIAEVLVDENTILFHSSIIEVDKEAYVFTAPSGTGKSTHNRLWREFFLDKKPHIINDDKPLIKIGNEIVSFGTPWKGKHGLGENRKAAIKAICFLSQGNKNEILEMSEEDKFPRLLRQTYRCHEKEKVMKTIELLKQIIDRIPIYEMKCTISYEAVEMAYEKMSN